MVFTHCQTEHVQTTLLDFNTWLQEKSEAHDGMQATQKKSSSDESAQRGAKVKIPKVWPKSSHRETQSPWRPVSLSKHSSHVSLVKGRHPVWRCAVFKEKTPMQRAKFFAEHKLCFSCLNDEHSFRKCSNPRRMH